VKWASRDPPSGSLGHGRKISHAINRIRSGSMSQNAHEIADALRAPFSWKLIVCAPSGIAPIILLKADSLPSRCSASAGTGRLQ
jgi:hypothetical protein